MSREATIVTAIDAKFFWGAMLLVCSIRSNDCEWPVHVVASDLTDEECNLLDQFKNVYIIDAAPLAKHIDLSDKTRASPALLKPRALLTAETESVLWVDSDCVFLRNPEPLIAQNAGEFVVRFRDRDENMLRFRGYEREEDAYGSIPRIVKERWCNDIGERKIARYTSTAVANCIQVGRKHSEFLELWDSFVVKLVTKHSFAVDRHNSVYVSSWGAGLSDELAFNALLCYGHQTPVPKPYLFDDDPITLLHFGTNPKPWVDWNPRHIGFFDGVVAMLDWAESNGYTVPSRPWSLRREFRKIAYTKSGCRKLYGKVKDLAIKRLRSQSYCSVSADRNR